METLATLLQTLEYQFGPGVFVILSLLIFISIVAQWRLFEKCGIPGYISLIPGWNVVAFLQIVGRPPKHALLFLIPGYNIYFLIKVYIELCRSFGRTSTWDYIFVILFNGLYVLNLGLSYEAHYKGPVFPRFARGQLA